VWSLIRSVLQPLYVEIAEPTATGLRKYETYLKVSLPAFVRIRNYSLQPSYQQTLAGHTELAPSIGVVHLCVLHFVLALSHHRVSIDTLGEHPHVLTQHECAARFAVIV